MELDTAGGCEFLFDLAGGASALEEASSESRPAAWSWNKIHLISVCPVVGTLPGPGNPVASKTGQRPPLFYQERQTLNEQIGKQHHFRWRKC